MLECDVAVIGAGPSGTYISYLLAKKGLDVVLLEEHGAVGLPRHDPGWLIESSFTDKIVELLKDRVPFRRTTSFVVRDPISGETLEDIPHRGYITRRNVFEREIAALAVEAGAKLILHAHCSDLLKEKGKVVGVRTETREHPQVWSKVVVCADGLRSALNGFASREAIGPADKVKEIASGMSLELANIAGIQPDIIELYLHPDPMLNYKLVVPQGSRTCITTSRSIETFNLLKLRRDNLLSTKFRNAYPLELSGYTCRFYQGDKFFNKIVKDGLLFVGEASGNSGAIHSMIQAYYASIVITKALNDGDISEEALSEYSRLVHETFDGAKFYWTFIREVYGSFGKWLDILKKIRVVGS